MYTLWFTKPFSRRYKKLVHRNAILADRLTETFDHLTRDPFYSSLKTHKAETSRFGIRYSSWVTGDLRIIWDFDEENRIRILLLDLGGHSGMHSVY